ncbi:antirestriction protein ArdR [Serratia proteamaculans]|uniref:antirestriction protein ArdR n=1 Tax=Serratia proteamaculans TaxID=28151 RepID=UPI0039B0ECF6
MDLLKIASNWRQENPTLNRPGGVVLIWEGMPYGWKDALRDVKDERPGAIAVDENGGIFIAEGGDDDMGAKCWVVLNQNQKTT